MSYAGIGNAGEIQLLPEQACIGIVLPMDDSDTMERSFAGRDVAYDRAHLLFWVGHRHDGKGT